MKFTVKFLATALISAAPTFLNAHEGHAVVGTLAHDMQHAGWMAMAMVAASVLVLFVFAVSANAADSFLSSEKYQSGGKHQTKQKRRN